jgi:CPA1 family monovalent cation:H+ antiporter
VGTAAPLIVIVATVLVGAWLAGRIGVPAPLVLIVIGIIGSVLPGVPEVVLSSDVVFFGVLPPLLYAAAIQTSLVDFRANRVAILSLSVGLVLFTALVVGLFLTWALQLPFAVAFAVGAIVGPPDAVAATAVGRQIGLPRRLVSILEGESLVNDATALVSLRTAVAAAGLAGGAVQGVSPGRVGLEFLWESLGGVAVGLVVAATVEVIRRATSEDATFDTVLSFLVPFVAYVPAEQVRASGVIAVVTAGLVLGHRSPRTQAAASRLSERINWSSIQFLLENAVFLLIGLQVSRVVTRVQASDLPAGQIVLAAVGTLVVVLLARPAWVFPYQAIADRHGRRGSSHWRQAGVLSWAGMRGVVTLAAALLLPEATPHRDVLILVAVVVTVGTLLIQGTSLPLLARWLGVRGPDPREDALQVATLMQAASRAGVTALEGVSGLEESTRDILLRRSDERTNEFWEVLGRRGDDVAETPSDAYRRARLVMLDAERGEVLRLRDEGRADHEALRVVLAALDLEEATLERVDAAVERVGDQALPVAPPGGACAHLAMAPACVEPRTPDGCEECLRDGTTWVHLRLCLDCGHVGCCDSSPERHSTGHFHQTQHPVIRSFEPGEAWRWCFVDEVTS